MIFLVWIMAKLLDRYPHLNHEYIHYEYFRKKG